MRSTNGNESNQRRIWTLQGAMLALNCVAVFAICFFVYDTTQRICAQYNARTFLDNVVTIPADPRADLLFCMVLMGVLAATFVARILWLEHHQGPWTAVTLALDVVVCALLIYRLDFNYNGVVLLVFANVVANVRDGKAKLLVAALAICGYLLADYNLLSIYLPLYRVSDYIQYYTADVQQYLFSINNVLTSLNIVLFVAYCICVIDWQRGTIEKVNQLYEELQSANQQLLQYADMSERMAQTRERNRLAREIHDTLGHTLTGIAAGLDACLALVEVSPEQTKKQLELLSKVSREGIKDVRRSVNELRPDALERLNLRQAIEEMVQAMSQISDVQIHFQTDQERLQFDADEENAIYRVIQEGITNAVRHGHAKEIWITLSRREQEVLLVIHDNGVGAAEIKKGFGTRHMKERIEMLQGTVTFDGSDGFTVTARIPIRWSETYD